MKRDIRNGLTIRQQQSKHQKIGRFFKWKCGHQRGLSVNVKNVPLMFSLRSEMKCFGREKIR